MLKTFGFNALRPTANRGIFCPASVEDRATLGSDPSATAVPYGTGGIPCDTACLLDAVGPNAINPMSFMARLKPDSSPTFWDENPI